MKWLNVKEGWAAATASASADLGSSAFSVLQGSLHLEVFTLAASAYLLAKRHQWNEAQKNWSACFKVPATKRATPEWPRCNKRTAQNTEQGNLPFTDTFAPMLLLMQGPMANEVLGEDETNNRHKKSVTQDQSKDHFISFSGCGNNQEYEKDQNEIHVYSGQFELSLPFTLPTEWTSNFLSFQPNPNCSGWSLFWNLSVLIFSSPPSKIFVVCLDNHCGNVPYAHYFFLFKPSVCSYQCCLALAVSCT